MEAVLSLALVLVVAVVGLRGCHAFSTGAPEASCADGRIPASHGSVLEATEDALPITVQVFTEFTNHRVTYFVANQTYDIQVWSKERDDAIMGYLLRDRGWNTTFADLDDSASFVDHRGAEMTFAPAASRVRCHGSGVTHPTTGSTVNVPIYRSFRVTARAPPDTRSAWTLDASVLFTAPTELSLPSSLPLVNSRFPARLGGALYTSISLPPFVIDASATAAMTEQWPLCPPRSLRSSRCSKVPIKALPVERPIFVASPTEEDVVFVAARYFLARATTAFDITQHVQTTLGYAQFLDVTSNGNVLLCGSGDGRSRCQYFDASTLNPVDGGWVATGAIAREETVHATYLHLEEGLYAGIHVPARYGHSDGATVITLSQLTDTDTWGYLYDNDNNEVYRSTAVSDDSWLEQPGPGKNATEFVASWVRNSSDPYVYFAYHETNGDSGVRESYIARLCRNNPPPPLHNFFNSFVTIRVRCLSPTVPMDVMTAAASTPHSPTAPGHPQRFYVAFRSTDPGPDDHFGYGVCSYTYEGTNSINYELSGRIDPQKTSSDFSCDRGQLDALFVVRANDDSDMDPDRRGFLRTSPLFTHQSDQRIVHMTVDALPLPDGNTLDVIWAVDSEGIVFKLPVRSDGSVTPERVGVIRPDAAVTTEFARISLLPNRTAAALSLEDKLVTLPLLDMCAAHTTCTACQEAKDPYCGWCAATASCVPAGNCPDPAANWIYSVFTANTAACDAHPVAGDVVVEDVSASSVQLSWARATASNISATFNTPSYTVRLDGTGAVVFGPSTSETSATITSLNPFTSYTLILSASNGAGITESAVEVVTRQAAPTAVSNLTVNAVAANSISIAWERPLALNGVLDGYIVRRDGVVLASLKQLTVTDTGLSPFTNYTYGVAAVTGETADLIGPLHNITVQTNEAPPGPMAAPEVTPLSDTELSVSWAPPPQPNGLLLRYDLFLSGQRLLLTQDAGFSPLATTANVSCLQANTAYNVSVRAVNGAGHGPLSNSTRTRTLVPTPPAVALPAFVYDDETHASLNVTWAVPKGFEPSLVVAYEVEVSRAYSNWSQVYTGPRTVAAIADPLPCTRYFARVRAVSSSGPGPFSTAAVTTTPSGAPPVPVAPATTVLAGNTRVLVQWPVPSACDAVGVRLQYWPEDEGAWKQVCCSGSGLQSSHVQNAMPNSTALFRLAFVFAQSQEEAALTIGPWSNVTAVVVPPNSTETTTVAPCEATEEPTQTTGDAQPTTAGVDTTALNVETTEDDGEVGGMTTMDTATTTTTQAPQPVTTNGTDLLAPSKVPRLAAAAMSAYSVRLSWSPPATAGSSALTRYDVFRGDIVICCDNANAIVTEDIGLLPSTTYTYRVRAWNLVGAGPLSDDVMVTTARAPPPKPAYPLLVGAGEDRLALRWEIDAGSSAQLARQTLEIYRGTSLVREVQPGKGVRERNVTQLSPLTAYRIALTVTIAGGLETKSDLSPEYFTLPNVTSRPKQVAQVQFKLPSMFLSQLADSSSPAFKTLASEVSSAVRAVFANTIGEQTFVVLSFAEGSIIVKGNLTTRSGPPLEEVLLRLRKEVDSGRLGGLATEADSFERLPDAGESGTCSVSSSSTASAPIAVVAALGGVLVLVLVAVGIAYCKGAARSRPRRKSELTMVEPMSFPMDTVTRPAAEGSRGAASANTAVTAATTPTTAAGVGPNLLAQQTAGSRSHSRSSSGSDSMRMYSNHNGHHLSTSGSGSSRSSLWTTIRENKPIDSSARGTAINTSYGTPIAARPTLRRQDRVTASSAQQQQQPTPQFDHQQQLQQQWRPSTAPMDPPPVLPRKPSVINMDTREYMAPQPVDPLADWQPEYNDIDEDEADEYLRILRGADESDEAPSEERRYDNTVEARAWPGSDSVRNSLMDTDDQVAKKLSEARAQHLEDNMMGRVDFSQASPIRASTKTKKKSKESR